MQNKGRAILRVRISHEMAITDSKAGPTPVHKSPEGKRGARISPKGALQPVGFNSTLLPSLQPIDFAAISYFGCEQKIQIIQVVMGNLTK